jgi:D-alanyl-D-alanine carboxypeptidase
MRRSILFLSVLISISCFGQTISTAKLDSFFNALEKRGLAMGGLSISQNGKIQYQRAVGFAYIDTVQKTPATINTKYRIGSETKMFTAVIIFQLIEEGRLSLAQKLGTWFPGLPNSPRITIAYLLQHKSGLHDYTEGTNFQDWMDKPAAQEQLLMIIREKGADFEPGTKTVYCNSNYLLLGYIIEKICKMPYAKAIEKRITSKIGLRNTYYGTAIDVKKNESASYKYAEGKWKKEKETDLSIHGGAGSVVSTSGDMVKFIEALFNYKLVSRVSVDKMKTITDGFGMGLSSYVHGEKTGFGHNGRVEEFYSTAIHFPKEKISISYITNGIIYPRKDIVDGVLKICFNEPFVAPFSTAIHLKPEDLDKYLGKYAADQMPIEVTCTKNTNKLLLETRGTTFELEPVSNNYFMHTATGYFFEFFPGKNELLVKETDNIYYLKRTR